MDHAVVKAIAAVFALALLVACGGSGSAGDDAAVPAGSALLDATAEDVLGASLATPADGSLTDQLLAGLGRPDAFVVAFEAGADGASVRRETWSYLELEAAVELVDGRLLDVRPLDPLAGVAIVPVWYDPLAFQPDTTLDDVRAMLADPDAMASTEVPAELGAGLTVYAADQLLVAFDAGGLVYAETVPLVAEESP